jgi:hypothetical protein
MVGAVNVQVQRRLNLAVDICSVQVWLQRFNGPVVDWT